MMAPMPFLTIQNVTKSYGDHQALKGVSFEVQEGELFGLLGPNGAGKTTMMSILSCLMDATAGGATLMTMPKAALVRAIVLNHWIHHRGQLSVYLRLLDVPLPSIYGPSADENPFAARTA